MATLWATYNSTQHLWLVQSKIHPRLWWKHPRLHAANHGLSRLHGFHLFAWKKSNDLTALKAFKANRENADISWDGTYLSCVYPWFFFFFKGTIPPQKKNTHHFFCKKKSLGKIHRQNLHNFCPDPWPEVFRPKSRGPSFSLGTAAASQQEVGPNPSRRNAVFYTSRLFPEALKDTAEKRRKWWNIIIKCNQRSFFVRSLLYEIEKNGRNWQRKIHESWDHWFSHTRNQVSECMECQPPHLFQALLECCKLQDLKLQGAKKIQHTTKGSSLKSRHVKKPCDFLDFGSAMPPMCWGASNFQSACTNVS